MFIPKCKKCGGKVISAYTNIEIETNGVLKTVTNTPAKKCSKCGHIIVDDITMEKAKQFGKPVQVGIIIPKSAGMAKFMNNNVAGIHVPDEMLEELKADKEKTKAGITGVEIAARIIKECKPYCQGVHIMALGWESKIPDLLKLAEI